MRISDLISMGQRYLAVGLFVAAILVVAFLIIYSKLLKGKKNVTAGKILFWGLFICYMVVVLGVTLLDRGGHWQNNKMMPLFYSYKDAWVNFSATSWRNIILNICMFIPFGFLLPSGISFFRRFWKTYFAGLIFTVFIEGVQMLLSRGIFELDDIMNNTVGAMIGYGIYALINFVILKRKKNQNRDHSIMHLVLLQIPLFITIAAFTLIFVSYARQELGNIGYQCLMPYDLDKLQVTSAIEFDKEETTQPVYRCKVLTKEEAESFAESYFTKLGTSLDKSQNDFYEDTAIFKAKERYSLWINYKGGTYTFTDFETSYPDEPIEVKKNVVEKEIRKALLSYGVEIPTNAVMEYDSETERYIFDVTENVGNLFLSGKISCQYHENEKFSDIDYSVITSEFYKDFKVISEQEAYNMICEGKFDCRLDDNMEIYVKECNLEYQTDSKGFYQPVYKFTCNMNGEVSDIVIAAIQDKRK